MIYVRSNMINRATTVPNREGKAKSRWTVATVHEEAPRPYPNGQNPGKTEVRLGSCVGVGLTSGTAVKETDYRQTPTSPAARWLSQRNDEVEEIALARTPRNMVSDGSRAGGV